MSNEIKIAIDAMDGEKSPKKIVDGILLSLKKDINNYFYLYGKENVLKNEISRDKLLIKHCEIINTEYFKKNYRSF